MKHSIKKGMGFGLTSGIITTLGLIVGLHAGTHSKIIILGGILVIAVADAFSDALGIHIAEETGHDVSEKHIWESTFSTLFFKIIFATSFIIPIWFLELQTAIIVSIVWGLLLLIGFTYYISKQKKVSPVKPMIEHVTIAIIVIVLTHFIGDWVAGFG
ncbi:MAG: hypothetical protein ABIH59_01430 [archaeon]